MPYNFRKDYEFKLLRSLNPGDLIVYRTPVVHDITLPLLSTKYCSMIIDITQSDASEHENCCLCGLCYTRFRETLITLIGPHACYCNVHYSRVLKFFKRIDKL